VRSRTDREAGTERESVPERRSYRIAVLAFFVVVALVLLSNIPLLYAYLNEPAHLKFMGITAGVRDANFYFMMMIQGDGWCPVLRNYFATGEPDTIYHGFFWFLLGKISHALGVGNLIVYHAARVAATVLFVPAAYYLASRFLPTTRERVTALLMLSFGAGAGWVQMIRFHHTGSLPFVPADIRTPEATSFFTLMSFPHLAIALILIGLCFAFVEASMSERKMSLAVVGGVCGLVLGLMHAVNLIVIYAALATFLVVWLALVRESYPARSVILFGSLSIWPIFYYTFLALARPELMPQVPVRSPTPVAYIVGFAPFLILSAVHAGKLVVQRARSRKDILLICWIVSNSLLLYSYPLLLQEGRALLGLQMPLVMLSSRAVFDTILPATGLDWQKAGSSSKKLLATSLVCIIIAFTFPSTCYNIFQRVSRLKHYPEAFSLTQEEFDALDFLRATPGTGIVLSCERIGSYVPRLTARESFLGQYDLPSRDSRVDAAGAFFASDTAESVRREILEENHIGFIFYGRHEREMGDFSPTQARYLKLIFHRSSVDIYRYEPQDSLGKKKAVP